MAQNFLYMFEFIVGDLLITRPNNCAPEEYPTCCEISFRSSVFLSICDREYGQCVDMCAPKCGKCCLFSLESPVTDKDRLLIHVYKKKTDKCKFLMGATELPVKALFDKVTENFNIENPNWMEQLAKHTARLPDPKTPSKTNVVDNDCDADSNGRKEQMCPTSEMTKRLLPLFNMKNKQTGNLVLILRLVCNGPTIVSTFPFAKMCEALATKKNPCQPCPTSDSRPKPNVCPLADPCKKEIPKPPVCRRYFNCNADSGCPCDACEDDQDRSCPPGCKGGREQQTKKPNCCACQQPPVPKCPVKDPCPKDACKQDDNCNDFYGSVEKQCPCAYPCDDECSNDEDEQPNECECECDCDCIKPCFVTPRPPNPGPQAYEEFEACLNGSGLVLRVLKDSHQVESIIDGTEQFRDNISETDKCRDDCTRSTDSYSDVLKYPEVANKHIRRRTCGRINNAPTLPKIRANLKYSGNDACCSSNYYVPFSKIKEHCDNLQNKVDLYRRKRGGTENDCVPPLHPVETRACCLQVDPQEIKNILKGINTDARKKGIEVCYKTCEDTESDVFLVNLASKKHCQQKKNSIQIELKTPKQPVIMPRHKVTTETQINEAELDAALAGKCAKKKGKGKKGKKGKK